MAPELVRTMVAASGVPIRIVDGQPYSAGELADRSRAVHGHLKALGYTSVTTAADITSGQVRATVTAEPGTGLRAATVGTALPEALRTGLDLDVVEGPANIRQTSLFGGMPTTRPGAGLICTTGFSVSPGGFVGVTTAAHCNNSEAAHNGARHPLNLFDEHLGDFGDVEWSTTSGVPVTDDFVAGSTETRDVTGVRALADMMIGDQACVFGQSTGLRRCSFIADLDVSITDRRGTSHRQVAVRDNITQVGDSGGPWFVGTVAYGTHVGNAQVNGASVSAFSVADLFDEALGVRVMR
ncbi:chymotrypsin family serine protease [Plantactinospora veratri]